MFAQYVDPVVETSKSSGHYISNHNSTEGGLSRDTFTVPLPQFLLMGSEWYGVRYLGFVYQSFLQSHMQTRSSGGKGSGYQIRERMGTLHTL